MTERIENETRVLKSFTRASARFEDRGASLHYTRYMDTGEGLQSAQTTIKPREYGVFGTYCGTSPLLSRTVPLHPSILTATHLTPLTLGEARLDTWTHCRCV